MTDFPEEQVEMQLTKHGVYVDELQYSTDACQLTYESAAVDANGVIPHQEVGKVINAIRETHSNSWEGVDISATVTDFDGTDCGRWHVDQEWLDDLHNDDLSEVVFSEKVIDTIEYTNE